MAEGLNAFKNITLNILHFTLDRKSVSLHTNMVVDEKMEFEGPDDDYEPWQTAVIALVWLTAETLGNCLVLALIHFYHNGGDPLKWRIVDHVRFYLIFP